MRFDTSQYPLISETTSFHFVDTRMSEQELKSRHRRETAKNIAIACVIVAVFALVISCLRTTGLSLL